MTRRDWWLGVAIVVAGLVASRMLPRYEFKHATGARSVDYVRIDRWTGHAEWGAFAVDGDWRGRWASVAR